MYCCQDPPILHQFQSTCICLAGPETWNWKSSSVRLKSSSPTSVVSISGGGGGGLSNTFPSGVDLSRPRGWKRMTQLYSTAYDNNSFCVPNIQVVYWLRTVVCRPERRRTWAQTLLIAGLIMNQAHLFSSLFGSNHDDRQVVCLN